MAETPKYSIIRKHNKIEIRQYPAYIQAEVVVDEKQYQSAIEKGFNILAGYIFGNNVSKQKIERQDMIQKNKQRLEHWLQEQGIETKGDFIVAGYNPPWVPGFLARNEVMIQVKNGL